MKSTVLKGISVSKIDHFDDPALPMSRLSFHDSMYTSLLDETLMNDRRMVVLILIILTLEDGKEIQLPPLGDHDHLSTQMLLIKTISNKKIIVS